MSKTHYVNPTIVNNTGGDIIYTPSSNSYSLAHGQFFSGPSSVTNGQSLQTFSAGSMQDLYGVNGWVEYSLPDGSNLYLMFNNPYTHEGTGSTGNQWLYACIDKFSKYSVTIDSSSFLDPVNPMSSDTISPVVNVYETQNMVPGNYPNQTFSSPTGNYVYINIINNAGFPISLNSMTNGYNSPPITDGNPPYVAETIPVSVSNAYTMAIFAVGGYDEYETTNGMAEYNLPNGDTLSMTWTSENNNSVTFSLGGSGAALASYTSDPETPSTITVTITS